MCHYWDSVDKHIWITLHDLDCTYGIPKTRMFYFLRNMICFPVYYIAGCWICFSSWSNYHLSSFNNFDLMFVFLWSIEQLRRKKRLYDIQRWHTCIHISNPCMDSYQSTCLHAITLLESEKYHAFFFQKTHKGVIIFIIDLPYVIVL